MLIQAFKGLPPPEKVGRIYEIAVHDYLDEMRMQDPTAYPVSTMSVHTLHVEAMPYVIGGEKVYKWEINWRH